MSFISVKAALFNLELPTILGAARASCQLH